jgi:hypothetical protein
MIWDVDLADELEAEWNELPSDVQDEILAHGKLLEQFGPQLGRPRRHLERIALREHEGTAV